jgi:hypothetical protein
MALTALVKGRTPPAPRKTRGLAKKQFQPRGRPDSFVGAVSPAIPL